MFSYILISKPSFDIKEKEIDNIFESISNNIQKKQNGTLNIVFLDDDSIQNLNKKYRNIDKTTDVLSFHYFDDFRELKKEDTA
ncbi:MAG: rRNA maturation RNase YbeY [Patescibacteria group bacterium]|nr:rRNA maturation RNase YbeY [Patescibacteria group bacterium]